MPFWITRNRERFGPYSAEELRLMLNRGQARYSDWVWWEDIPQWLPIGTAVLNAQPAVSITPPAGAVPFTNPPNVNTAYIYFMPPDLHWIWLVVLGVLTFGIFPFIWFLVMAGFVRKLAPDWTPMGLEIIGFASISMGNYLKFAHALDDRSAADMGLTALLTLGGIACLIVARFRMRRTLLIHYNSVEPIRLYLSDAMTFFFGTCYFQYHFSRIARWKKTGYLSPQ
jgi:GYF domain 2